ncbi:MAG: hypothetical protein C5B59_08800 [Bacteroidetes bacterium]|nr:MAG: hypothetical protein C5B59_08800 [Bacteroidota bacterium]
MRSKAEYNAYKRKYRSENPEYRDKEKKRQARASIERKERVLTHYGGGKVKCRWEGCGVSDIDVLSIDHVFDDGAEHREKICGSKHTKVDIYRWLEANGFPEGYQTLCLNHQFKKEILRRKRERKWM